MKARMQYLSTVLIVIPVVYYLANVISGDIQAVVNLKIVISLFFSTAIGLFIGALYGEFLWPKIPRYPLIITCLVGLALGLVLRQLFGKDSIINLELFNMSFVISAVSYQKAIFVKDS